MIIYSTRVSTSSYDLCYCYQVHYHQDDIEMNNLECYTNYRQDHHKDKGCKSFEDPYRHFTLNWLRRLTFHDSSLCDYSQGKENRSHEK